MSGISVTLRWCLPQMVDPTDNTDMQRCVDGDAHPAFVTAYSSYASSNQHNKGTLHPTCRPSCIPFSLITLSTHVHWHMGTLLQTPQGSSKTNQALTLLQKMASRTSSRSFASIIGDFPSSPSFFQTTQVSWVRFQPLKLDISYGIVCQNHISMTDVTSQEWVSLQNHLSFGRSATLTTVDIDSGWQIFLWLRPAFAVDTFLPKEDVIFPMLHEVCLTLLLTILYFWLSVIFVPIAHP